MKALLIEPRFFEPAWRRWVVASGYTVLLTVLLLSPTPTWDGAAGPEDFFEYLVDLIPDWSAHFGTYAILGVVLIWAARSARWDGIAICVALAIVHGAVTEFLQGYVPGRTPDLGDFYWNGFGIFVGVAVFTIRSRVNRSDVRTRPTGAREP